MADNQNTPADQASVPKSRGPHDPQREQAEDAAGAAASRTGKQAKLAADPTGPRKVTRGAREQPNEGAAPKQTTRAGTKKAAKATKAKVTKTAKATKAVKATKPTGEAEAAKTKTAKATDETSAAKTVKAADATETTSQPQEVPEGVTSREIPAPGAWLAAAWDAARHLDQPPTQLAELTVAELGPRVAAWVGWLRATYSDAPAHGITRLASRQARRHGLVLTVADAAGPLVVLQAPAMAAARALLVLKIAAAYGHDPAEPARANDLIMLLGLDSDPGRSRLVRGAGLVIGAANRLRRRRRSLGAMLGLLVAASERDDSLERLAHRAVRHFRQLPPATAEK